MKYEFTQDQIGSDEVGTGDFFGPIVVAAVLLKEKEISELIKNNKIKDSKAIKDSKILKIGEFIVKNYPYKCEIINNQRLNEATKNFNMNEIKCLLHNKVLHNLHSEHEEITFFCIDEFVKKEKYYEYLKKRKVKNILENIVFKTKGEIYFPSVAAASIVARYYFIKEMKKIGEQYKTKIPFGATYKKTIPFAIHFIKEHGKDEFDKIVKMNFKNYNRILKEYSKIN